MDVTPQIATDASQVLPGVVGSWMMRDALDPLYAPSQGSIRAGAHRVQSAGSTRRQSCDQPTRATWQHASFSSLLGAPCDHDSLLFVAVTRLDDWVPEILNSALLQLGISRSPRQGAMILIWLKYGCSCRLSQDRTCTCT